MQESDGREQRGDGTFLDSFWDGSRTNSGFLKLAENCKQGTQAFHELGEYFRLRSEIEARYAKDLEKLAVSKLHFGDLGMITPCVNILRTTTKEVSEVHQKFSVLMHDVFRQLANDAQLDKRRQVQDPHQNNNIPNLFSQMQSGQHAIDKAIKTVHTREREVKEAKSAKQRGKLEASLAKARLEHEAACSRYNGAVAEYIGGMERVVGQFEECERIGLNTLTKAMIKYCNHEGTKIEDTMNTMMKSREKWEALYVTVLVEMYIQKNATGSERPQLISVEHSNEGLGIASGSNRLTVSNSGSLNQMGMGSGASSVETSPSTGKKKPFGSISNFFGRKSGSSSNVAAAAAASGTGGASRSASRRDSRGSTASHGSSHATSQANNSVHSRPASMHEASGINGAQTQETSTAAAILAPVAASEAHEPVIMNGQHTATNKPTSESLPPEFSAEEWGASSTFGASYNSTRSEPSGNAAQSGAPAAESSSRATESASIQTHVPAPTTAENSELTSSTAPVSYASAAKRPSVKEDSATPNVTSPAVEQSALDDVAASAFAQDPVPIEPAAKLEVPAQTEKRETSDIATPVTEDNGYSSFSDDGDDEAEDTPSEHMHVTPKLHVRIKAKEEAEQLADEKHLSSVKIAKPAFSGGSGSSAKRRTMRNQTDISSPSTFAKPDTPGSAVESSPAVKTAVESGPITQLEFTDFSSFGAFDATFENTSMEDLSTNAVVDAPSSVDVDATVRETINCYHLGPNMIKCVVTGQVSLSLPFQLIDLPFSPDMKIVLRVNENKKLANVKANESLVDTSAGSLTNLQKGIVEIDISKLTKVLEEKQKTSFATFEDISILAYDVTITDMSMVPIRLCSIWNSIEDRKRHQVTVHFAYNTEMACELTSFFLALPELKHVKGNPECAPVAEGWTEGDNRILWKCSELKADANGRGKFVATFETSEALNATIAACKFECMSRNISGANVELDESSCPLVSIGKTSKTFTAGKYMAESA
eukprot:Nk52_evm7s331 gene=Nk52_evmTU7s331